MPSELRRNRDSDTIENRKSILQKLIQELHAEASPQEAKEPFEEVLREIDIIETAKIEQTS